jgi:hypothetical protein
LKNAVSESKDLHEGVLSVACHDGHKVGGGRRGAGEVLKNI